MKSEKGRDVSLLAFLHIPTPIIAQKRKTELVRYKIEKPNCLANPRSRFASTLSMWLLHKTSNCWKVLRYYSWARFRVSLVIDSGGGGGPWYLGNMHWYFYDKLAYFRLQSLVGICLHRIPSRCHNVITMLHHSYEPACCVFTTSYYFHLWNGFLKTLSNIIKVLLL